MFSFVLVHPGKLVEFRNFTRDVYRQGRGVKPGGSLDTGLAAHHPAAEVIFPDTQGANHANTGDDHPWTHESSAASPLSAKWDNQCTHAARRLHVGSVLPDEV